MKLLTTAYFPPIEYFAQLAKCSVFIDGTEHYQKQSWRNRCRILGANGPEDLRFPVVHDGKRAITEVLVDYRTDWVRRSEYAIETAYYSSPFFEYYRDELFAILDSHPQTLWELNSRITEFFCRKIGIPSPGVLLEAYHHPSESAVLLAGASVLAGVPGQVRLRGRVVGYGSAVQRRPGEHLFLWIIVFF